MKRAVVARDRTVLVEDSMTIREVIQKLNETDQVLSLRKTFQLYGIQFVEERSFVSRYRADFNLSKSKSMYDIRVRELVSYKDNLIGIPARYLTRKG